MESFEISSIDISKSNKPYENQTELLDDCFAVLDYHLYVYYVHHQWLGPENDLRNMLGMVVTREEFEHVLSQNGIKSLYHIATEEEASNLEEILNVHLLRLRNSFEKYFPAMQILQRFNLSSFQWLSLMLCYAASVDERYEKMCAYLQDDINKKHPTPLLCIRLFMQGEERPESYLNQFSKDTLFGSLFDPEENLLVLRKELISYLCQNLPQMPKGMELFTGKIEKPLITHFEIAKKLDLAMESSEKKAIFLSGPLGCGKCFQIKHLCTRNNNGCVFADMEILEHNPKAVQEAAFLSRLLGVYLCLFHLDSKDAEGNSIPPSSGFIEALKKNLEDFQTVFLLSEKSLNLDLNLASIEISMEKSTEKQRAELFSAYLEEIPTAEDVDPFEMASKFTFEPKQIAKACEKALGIAQISQKAVDAALLHRCCYSQVVSKLSNLAVKIKPNFTWDDVVMPENQKKTLKHACSYIKYKHKVYQEWGFDSRISYGRGLSILFAGVPGTGKTMSAQVIAKQLNMEMYKINISQIVSKYIGETEKNLQTVFSEAKKANCILFFDECDALFGKRSEVKDAHDRNANVEVAYLLQQIEEFDGVCVLATNLLQNIDEAFMRRITYVIRFPFPDAKARKEIYRRTLPSKTPVEEDIDWDFLAEKFPLSGGHLKNIVLSAAFLAASENAPISMAHLLNAAVGEMKKNDIVVVREELRQYAYLLE